MRKNVIHCYEAIDEDGRLSYNNVRQVEYQTNLQYLKKVIQPGDTVLDCACGTGAYVIPLAQMGARLWAYDLTPKHIQILNGKLADLRPGQVKTGVCDAQDLGEFPDGFFDAVLCMGPLYHLTTPEEQWACVQECVRVVKQGGVLAFAYLNRTAILPYMLQKEKQYFRQDVIERFLREKRTLWGEDEFCFFTDSYYHIPEEVEQLMALQHISRLYHIGSDGLSYDYEGFVNGLNDEEFATWMAFHLQVCEQGSLLGASQHGLYIGRTASGPAARETAAPERGGKLDEQKG